MSECRIFHYLVTVELQSNAYGHDGELLADGDTVRDELDSNLESCITTYDIEHFTVEQCDLSNRNVPLLDYRERIIRSHES